MQRLKSAPCYVGLCFLLSLACHEEIIIGRNSDSVVGVWSKQIGDSDKRKLTLRSNNSYQLDRPQVFGNYSIQNDQISLFDTAGPDACPENPGVYKFELGGFGFFVATLTLTLVSDPCSGRSSVLPGIWVIGP